MLQDMVCSMEGFGAVGTIGLTPGQRRQNVPFQDIGSGESASAETVVGIVEGFLGMDIEL
jgi:hypothetical protein